MFEELDDEHQVEFLRERSDQEVAGVLARMASDDAADLLLELEQDRRLPILNLLPAAKQRKIKRAARLQPVDRRRADESGLPLDAVGRRHRRRRARARTRERADRSAGLRRSALVDEAGVLVGVVTLADLVRAGADEIVSTLLTDEAPTPTVAPEADLPDVARLMTDYNLIAMPVVDGDGRPVGRDRRRRRARAAAARGVAPPRWRWPGARPRC